MGAPNIGRRLFQSVAPEAGAALQTEAAPIVRGFMGFAERVASQFPEAAPIANVIRPLRDRFLAHAGTVMADADPILQSLTPEENSGLAKVLLARVPREQAASLLTPRTVDLLQRGYALEQQSGVPFASNLRQNMPALSSKAIDDGAGIFATAVKDQAEPLLLNTLRTHVRPAVRQLQDPQAIKWTNRLLDAVDSGGGGGGSKFLPELRALNSATLLGRSVIGNATQGVGGSGVVAGLKPTLSTLQKFITPAGRAQVSEQALRLGTQMEGGYSEYFNKDLHTGPMANFSSKVLRATAFNAVERFNRRWATSVGSDWFNELASLAPNSEAAQKQLLRHGVADPLAAGAHDQFVQNFVRRTQFRMTPEELPAILSMPGTRGELVKTMIQFKPFTYKATELMLQELKHNPTGYLARSIGFGLPIGGLANELRYQTGGRKERPAIPQQMIEAVFALGVGGMAYDLMTAAIGGEQKVLEAIGGPSAGLAAEGLTGAVRTLQGRPSKLVRSVVRRIPVAGSYLAGKLPHSGGKKTSTYAP